MKYSSILCLLLTAAPAVYASPVLPAPKLSSPQGITQAKHLRPVIEKRQQFAQGEPIDANGKGGPILGGTNKDLDLQNPDNLGEESTDSGLVTNLKWSFSDSKTKIVSSTGIEWLSGVSYTLDHSLSPLSMRTERTNKMFFKPETFIFDDGNFDATGTTFMVDDWVAHTPKDILAKNFGVNASVFSTVPATDPYILKGNISTIPASSPYGTLSGNSSYVYHASQHPATPAPGGGGTIQIVDSRNFPIATTIAAAIVTVEPKGLRELHWHPNAAEWIYFHQGQARATVFLGGANARTFDFTAGDTAVFPDNSGHYVENTSETEKLVWIEIYKSDRVADISLTQWLALTPPEIVAQTLNISLSVVEGLKKEKQLIVA